ncbi:magnesium transporter [Haloferula sp.]|uniref:magnesium transporter n=1 Tax=Haloferula sp. TaxID=2497595 RepID=UPI003C7623ED
MPDEIAPLPIEDLARAIEAEDQSAIRALAGEMHYADLAHIYQDTDEEKHSLILKTIGPVIAADMIVQLPDSMIEEALDYFSPSELKILFRELSDDDRVDILQDVGDEARLRFLGLLGPEDEELTRSLLRYEEDTAGGRMTTRFGRLFANMTIKEAIDMLRREQESTETLSRIFVVDVKGRLIGRVRLRDLAFNTWNTPIRDIMKEVGPEQRILATADQEDAANLLLKYDLIVLPVVDEFGHLLGIITHDDAMEILQEESTEDMEKLAGIAGETVEETYLQASVATHFKRRFVWLFFLALLAIASGYVMMRFEGTLMKIFLLSLYLPMVVAAGGNTGGQASTMVIRAMSLGELIPGTASRVLWKELRLGIFLGCTLGCSIAALTIFILPAFRPELPEGITFTRFGMTIAIALAAQITTSTVIGALLPLGARAIRLDPAVVAAPAITTVVDVSGMVIYFTIAQAVLGL